MKVLCFQHIHSTFSVQKVDKIISYLKIYSHKSVFIVMFKVIKTQHLRIFFSVAFIIPFLIHHSVFLWNNPCMHAFSEQVIAAYYCNVLTCLLNKQMK